MPIIDRMRPLSEDETRVFFTKLSQFLGDNIRFLIDREDQPFVFRLHEERVYYLPDSHWKLLQNFGRDELVCAGTLFGKFTKSGKFHLHVTCLDYLCKYARYKVWVKPGGEQIYLYGHNVLKAHLARMTENTPQYQGVVVLNLADVPLGFGVTARATEGCLKLQPQDIVVFHQADLGEYLRNENPSNAYD
jgi:60S ribosome subunit biogenesis protein NIP7